jgi:hypothetical protein
VGENENTERAGVRGVPGRMSQTVRSVAPNGRACLGTTCASMCVTKPILLFVFLLFLAIVMIGFMAAYFSLNLGYYQKLLTVVT